MKKLDLKTKDGIDANLEKLSQLFPEVITEIKDENGKIRRVADFEKLKMILGDDAAESAQEFYEFTWPGKNEAIMEAAKSTNKTLRPCPEESKNWDSTQNLYIEGDNLEVLKLLQESYLGKVFISTRPTIRAKTLSTATISINPPMKAKKTKSNAMKRQTTISSKTPNQTDVSIPTGVP